MKRGECSWEEFEKLRMGDSKILKFTVVTPSMAPLIAVGEAVVVDVGAPLNKGDIIVFWQDNKLVCHIFWHQNRIIQDQGQTIFCTRPLQGNAWDVSIRENQILGKVLNYRVPTWRIWLLRWREFRRSRG